MVDCAVLVLAGNLFGKYEIELIHAFNHWDVPYIIVHNKSDELIISEEIRVDIYKSTGNMVHSFSTLNPENLDDIIAALKKRIPENVFKNPHLIGDLVNKGDYVLLITPIDNEAPDGRMILPQVMAIRDVLDHDCINIVLKEDQVEQFFRTSGIKPGLAITDSQVFNKMKNVVPDDVPFTSFSIVFARHRGDFENFIKGTPAIDNLTDGDRILILESCTHQVNCDDIGRHKLPEWIKSYTGKRLDFDVVSGLNNIKKDMTDYALVVQCGGCMVTRRQLKNRLKSAIEAGVPVTNYGMTIAWINGIFERVTQPFIHEYA